MKKKISVIILFILLIFQCACSFPSKEPYTVTAMKLNTIVTITLYDSVSSTTANEALALCDRYDVIFSRTNTDSELYKLNNNLLPKDEDGYCLISTELYDIISCAKEYAALSDNAFDPAIEPLTSLWDFSSGQNTVPPKDKIEQALPYLSPDDIILKEPNKIKLANTENGIDLGGIAKGYIADKIAEYLMEKQVQSAIIDLGGNLLCLGNKGNQPFTIGIQKPFSAHGEYLATVEVSDKSVVSSGIYERYFEADGAFYHHILNPQTGYPYKNDLIGVTILTDSSTKADALSTTCFSLGLEKGLALVEKLDNVDAVFIDSDNNLHYSDGFTKKYHLQLAD